MEEFNEEFNERAPNIKGAMASYLYRMDAGPKEFIMVAVFRDHETYEANADDPEQDRWYQQFRALLEADPEWNDREITVGWRGA